MNNEFEHIHQRQMDWYKSNFVTPIEPMTGNFKNRSATRLLQMQFDFNSAQDVKEYCSILRCPSTKSVTFLICGIDGWTVSITGAKKFRETSQFSTGVFRIQEQDKRARHRGLEFILL